MAEEDQKKMELNNLKRRRRNVINNVNKSILGLIDELINNRPTRDLQGEASSFLEALNENENVIKDLNDKIETFIEDVNSKKIWKLLLISV